LSPVTHQYVTRLGRDFFSRDVLTVAPEFIGKILVRRDGSILDRYTIIEAEAYRGEEDEASHARFGRTARNSVMYGRGGLVYVYLIYGMYWMLNVVTGPEEIPQAILIRGLSGHGGPGILTRALGIDRSFYGEDLVTSDRLWMEDSSFHPPVVRKPRVGITYAGEPWKSTTWRFMAALPACPEP